ncbi:hypothetical protein SDRG_02431 [Saprolegnia diclina VS20]|uniref:AB hydrolase-1 domain-containing protein n=1 Tax=Saprolegnia diclina (strain VS20) TaxID=1156394 RepID=T0R0S7_SAPDV|nr:hypothetical protein SDRG_02431 [Saprolegnia diclina VS20]EQC40541.1 hypothetical protein SDRG_02431 [Saprolegnia diclina VS20]|eukprot:XP_008606240.1 hypothetical protein SDRG_02431 [Saprolegnia diclina VS20]
MVAIAQIPPSTTTAEPVHATLTLSNEELLHYSTYGPATAAKTFVLLHGAPGAYTDFKYLSPLLVTEPDTNAIVFDLPGSGRTSMDTAGGLASFNSTGIAEAVIDAWPRLSLSRAFLIGHSMGGQTALLVAASSAVAPTLCGLALLNPAGFGPHHVSRPLFLAKIWACALRFLGDGDHFLQRWTHSFYLNTLRFPKTTLPSSCVAAILHVSSPDYARIESSARVIQSRGLSTFMALASDDRIVEVAIGHEVADVLKPSVLKEYPTGGHNIQKTQAADLGLSILAWSNHDGKL